jgi:hypothetical protein
MKNQKNSKQPKVILNGGSRIGISGNYTEIKKKNN